MFAGINFLLATFVYFCESAASKHIDLANVYAVIPETKQVLLEEMDTKFGGSNHVEKGGDLLGVEDAHHADLDLALPELSSKNQTEHIQEVRA